MVSAKFLAEIDMRLRSAAQAIGTHKKDAAAQDRPFGGLNVILAGDFWQLPPPERGSLSLATIPRDLYGGTQQRSALPTSDYGLSLMWSFDPQESVQGMTELWRPERCKDTWYNEVLEQCRLGNLTTDNYHVQHGGPTSVPGSWQDGAVLCASP